MQVDSAAASSNVAATPSTKPASGTIDYNTFLQLMIAEMKFQDPTTDGYQPVYVAVRAVLVGRAGHKTNTKLDSLLPRKRCRRPTT